MRTKGIEIRWLAIKLFERDENIIDKLNISINTLDEIEVIIKKYKTELDDDSESIVTGERYAFIGNVVSTAIKKQNKGKETTSDKIRYVLLL